MWKWFKWVLLILGLIIIGLIIFFATRQKENNTETITDTQKDNNIIKNIGFNLDYYNPETNKAGDMEFFKITLPSKRLFMNYGYIIPAEQSANRVGGAEIHPSIILPLGTKVLSPIDGIVTSVPTLYSNDRSVQITPNGKKEGLIFELEHVKDPLVKEGDKVTAGQPVAEVTDFSTHNHPGYGYFDFAVFHTNNNGEPEHLCPFLYLSNDIKEETYAKIRALYSAWEDYMGDTNIYEESYEVPGCVTTEPMAG